MSDRDSIDEATPSAPDNAPNSAPDRADADGLAAWKLSPLLAAVVIPCSLILFTLVALATNAEPVMNLSPSGPVAPGSPRNSVIDTSRDAVPEIEDRTRTPAPTPPRLPTIVGVLVAALVIMAAVASLGSWVSGNSVRWKLGSYLAGRFGSHDHEPDTEPDALEVAQLASDLRDRLLLDTDPRRAIQRAYAAVEGGFGIDQLRRDPAETPLKYLNRVFGRIGTVQAPLAQLTSLFEVARFSTRPITPAMRDDAADALDHIRRIYLDEADHALLSNPG